MKEVFRLIFSTPYKAIDIADGDPAAFMVYVMTWASVCIGITVSVFLVTK